MDSIANTVRHGLVVQRILARLRGIGLDLNPYYLFREGLGAQDMLWSDLSAAFPSSVAEAAQLPALAECTERTTVELLQERLDKGNLCFVIMHRGEVAGYTWADLEEVNDVSCDYKLERGEAYLYDAFVAPEHRGRALAPYLRYESYELLRRLGITTFYSISGYFNSPAIRFKQKLNAEKFRLYVEIKLGRWRMGQWVLREYR